jgi:hypothetical protein
MVAIFAILPLTVQFIATPQMKRPQGLIACIMNSIYRVNMDGKHRMSMQEIF